MRIVHRYILKEFFQQFIIWGSVIAVLGVGKILFDYNDLFIGYRVTGFLLLKMILSQVPALMMDVLSFATLFGVLLFMSRLIRERELDVIRLSGARLSYIMLPVFGAMLILCCVAFFWNDRVVPAANHHFQVELKRLSSRQDLPLIKENVVFKGPNNRFIYLNRVNHKEGRIDGILIIEPGVTGRWPRLVTADYGLVKVGTWVLYNGTVHLLDAGGSVAVEERFQKMELRMGNDFTALVSDDRTPYEMTTSDLLKQITAFHRSDHIVFYQMKFADSLIALILAFLGVPLALSIGRNARWLGFILAILIILAYWTMQVIGKTMGINGVLSPWVAVWTPHLLFLTLGVILLFRAEQRR